MRNYERHWRSLRASGGERTVWELPFPYAVTLTKLAVEYVGGDLGVTPEFTVDIFNSRRGTTTSESSGGTDPEGEYTASPNLYRVCPTIHSDGGSVLHFFTGGDGNYVNMDTVSPTNKERKIYLEIQPTGGGDMSFDVALGCVISVW